MANLKKLNNLKEKINKSDEMFKKYQERLEQEKEKYLDEIKNILYKNYKNSKLSLEEYLNLIDEKLNESSKENNEQRNEEITGE